MDVCNCKISVYLSPQKVMCENYPPHFKTYSMAPFQNFQKSRKHKSKILKLLLFFLIKIKLDFSLICSKFKSISTFLITSKIIYSKVK